MKGSTKECLKRTLRTAFQAFIGSMAAQITTSGVSDFEAFRAVAVSMITTAIAASIAAAMNLPKLQEGDR